MKFYINYTLLFLLLVCADTYTKYISTSFESPVFIIPHLLSFQYAQNIGIAFSIPITGIVLKAITVTLIFGIIWYYFKEERSKKSRLIDLSYILILAGAVGNAWERIFRGYVTDFISLEHFAIFNLADSYISIGALGIIYFYLLKDTSGLNFDQKK